MSGDWRTPGAVLVGCGVIAIVTGVGLARISRAIEGRLPGLATSSAVADPQARFPAASPEPPVPAPPAAATALVEYPLVTYDSFDRRFSGPLLAEAEAKCWAAADARHASEDIVYLLLDVATDGTVLQVEPEEPPPDPRDPEQAKLAELHRCVATVAKKVRFMTLPAAVRGARVAAHRHVQKN